MTPRQFTEALAASRLDPAGRTAAAVRLVLVDGLTAYAAAKRIGIHESAVGRALAKLRRPVCSGCGRPL